MKKLFYILFTLFFMCSVCFAGPPYNIDLDDMGDITVDDLTVNGSMTINTTDGIDVNPGSDVDATLVKVGVTGDPEIKWDESFSGFSFENGRQAQVNNGNAVFSLYTDANNNSSTSVNNIELHNDGPIGSATQVGTFGWDEVQDVMFLGYGEVTQGNGGDINIDSSGNIGIGTSSPNATFTTNGSIGTKRTDQGAADYNPSILTTDYRIVVNNSAAARAVTISTEDVQSGTTSITRDFIIIDEYGSAGTYPITITLENGGTISGAASNVISSDYDTRSFYCTGTNCFLY